MIRPLLVVVLAGASSSCAGADSEPAPGEPPAGPSCADLACRHDMAAVRFVNEAAARRFVSVDGDPRCALDPGAECVVLVEPATEIVVHVTADDDPAPCSGDPRATLAECACATFRIRC